MSPSANHQVFGPDLLSDAEQPSGGVEAATPTTMPGIERPGVIAPEYESEVIGGLIVTGVPYFLGVSVFIWMMYFSS